jgi:hypothetical protein
MSQFLRDEQIKQIKELKQTKQIKLSIKEETEKINKCILEVYNKNFPKDLLEFEACCNVNEIKLLIKCYKIFSENKNLQVLDYDFIKALIMYYYNITVLEYYIHTYIDESCLKKTLTTDKSKEYYNLLYVGSEDWISQIRRLVLNMNTEPFEGYKGGKKITKKNTKKKRNLKKICKKSRKNKGKKRVNKIKYTKK